MAKKSRQSRTKKGNGRGTKPPRGGTAKKSSASRRKKGSRTLTPEDHDFIRQILASPDEDAPRLAYADWLEQQGERDRAEFIRCQIAAARLASQDPQREEAVARADRLLETHQAEWQQLPPEVAEVARVAVFERGFPVWGRCPITDFAEQIAPHLPQLWRVAPVTQLELYDYNAMPWDADFNDSWIPVENYEALAKMPELVHVRSLTVGECEIRDKHLEALLASPHLTNLRELSLGDNGRLGDAGARVVAEWPRATSLTTLDLSGSGVGNPGAEALARSPHLSSLKTLLLRVNRVGVKGGRAIASSPHLANLEKLDLGGNALGAAEEKLRERFGDRLIL